MVSYLCDGCRRSWPEAILVSGRYRFCRDCHPVCCVCRRSSEGDSGADLDEWRVNGFRINNRQFICGNCRWKPADHATGPPRD